MLIDSPALVEDFDLTPALGPLVVSRPGAGALNEYHEHVDGAATTHEVTPWTAHTATGTVLEQVPEADRNSEHVAVYASGFLFELGDRFTYDGATWRVNTRNNYMTAGSVSFATAAKEDP